MLLIKVPGLITLKSLVNNSEPPELNGNSILSITEKLSPDLLMSEIEEINIAEDLT